MLLKEGVTGSGGEGGGTPARLAFEGGQEREEEQKA